MHLFERACLQTKPDELTQMQKVQKANKLEPIQNTQKRIALLVNSTNCRIQNVLCTILRIFVVNHTLINGL